MVKIHSENRVVSEWENLGADINNQHQAGGCAEGDQNVPVVKKEPVFFLTHG